MDKLCECGCGQPTKFAPHTNTAIGWVKGQPIRFIVGHNGRLRVAKRYPARRGRGQRVPILEHRQRAERALGKPLPPKAIVHHADGVPQAGGPLVICQDQAYHLDLHRRLRIVKAGGNPWTEKVCCRCKQVKPRTAFGQMRIRSDGYLGDGLKESCRACHNAAVNAAYHRKRAVGGATVP